MAAEAHAARDAASLARTSTEVEAQALHERALRHQEAQAQNHTESVVGQLRSELAAAQLTAPTTGTEAALQALVKEMHRRSQRRTRDRIKSLAAACAW